MHLTFKITIVIVLTLSNLILWIPFAKRYVILVIKYAFNIDSDWNYKIDKARLFIYFFLGFLMIYVSQIILKTKPKPYNTDFYTFIIGSLFIIVLAFCSTKAWGKGFENMFLPKTKKKIKDLSSRNNSNNFDVIITSQKAEDIFNGLIKNHFLEENTKFMDFYNVLSGLDDEETSDITFLLNNNDFKLFYELLYSHNKNKELKFKPFIKNKKRIKNKKSNNYSYNTIKDSIGSDSKHFDKINEIFN